MKNLRLGTKIALAIIPIGLVALLVGGLLVQSALNLASQQERASVAAEVAASAMDAFEAFLEEQEDALGIALGRSQGNVESHQAATDDALERLSDSVIELIPLAAGPAADIVTGIFTDSNRARSLVDAIRNLDPTSPEAAETVDGIGRRLISVVTGASFYLGDESRVREGEGAVALGRAALASFQQETLIVLNEAGISEADAETLSQQLQVLEWTVEDWVHTASDSSPTVRALGFTRTLLAGPDQVFTSGRFDSDRHEEFVDAAAGMLRRVSESAAAEAAAARTRAGAIGAIVLGALVLAALAAFALGRSTTNRVRSVTAAAHRVAEVDLPKMVDSLSNPRGELEATTLEDLDETGKDEVSDLARSFSTLHGTLVQVANQQMETLRKGVSEIFVVLARRNRSLVDRQLALVDQLESREEDPEILDGYYKLDHLATRMRRNAESLLVLAGVEAPRMWSEPVEMGDVVRAAIGEVDEYQRVSVLAVEPSLLSGKVVTDVSHLLAELLENATQYSPPTERVRVTGLFDDAGYVVIIADSGVGVSAERRAELNDLIENPPVVGLALQPTLGMYVVARLAKRNGINVRIVEGVPGTTVRVTIPRELLATNRDTVPTRSDTDDPAAGDRSQATSASGRSLASEAAKPAPDVAATVQESTTAATATPVDGADDKATTNEATSSSAISPFQRASDTPRSNGQGGLAEDKPAPAEDRSVQRAIEDLRAVAQAQESYQAPDKAGEAPSKPAPQRPREAEKPSPPKSESGTLPTRPAGSAASPGAPRHLKRTAAMPGDPSPTRPTPVDSSPTKPKPAEPTGAPNLEPQARTDQTGSPLPTRNPGASFQEADQEGSSTSASRAGALGIRSALDGYRQGRDIAARASLSDDDETTGDDEETK